MRQDFDWHRKQTQRSRQQRRRRESRWVTWGEVRLVLLGGVVAGLVFALSPAAWTPSGAAASGLAAPTTYFPICDAGPRVDCVVDGDTFWMAGEKIRVADIDTPETHPARCAEEQALGNRATSRFQQLLNAGPVTLASIDRDTDRYGRKLRVVMRGGESLGETLVAEGLARRWIGHREPWC